LPKKCNSNTGIKRSESIHSTQSTHSNHSLLDLDSDNCERVRPPVKPRRIDSSILQSTKVIQPKFYDSSNFY